MFNSQSIYLLSGLPLETGISIGMASSTYRR